MSELKQQMGLAINDVRSRLRGLSILGGDAEQVVRIFQALTFIEQGIGQLSDQGEGGDNNGGSE